jgi:hypothetical protein
MDLELRRAIGAVPRLDPRIVQGVEPADALVLRIRGSPRDVLHDWDATHYWTGAVEVPVSVLVERSKRAAAK